MATNQSNEAKWGLKIYNPNKINNLFTSNHQSTKKPLSNERELRQIESLAQQILQGGNKGQVARTMSVSSHTDSRLHESQQAAQRIFNGADMVVIDTETLGEYGKDYFDVPEISLLRHNYQTGESGEVIDLVNEVTKPTANRLKRLINQLENDPTSVHRMSEMDKRSVTALYLYSDESLFKTTTAGGQVAKILTGHPEGRPGTSGVDLTQGDYIAKYKKGLSNLQNTNLVNTQEGAKEILANELSGNTVIAGQNNTVFDRQALDYYARTGKSPHNKSLQRKIREAALDSLPTTQSLPITEHFNPKNYTLGEIDRALNPEGIARTFHHAGDDAEATLGVLINVLDQYKSGGIKFAPEQTVTRGDIFVANKGTGMYYESDFNRNKGQYDITLRLDKTTGKLIRNYDNIQEPAITGGGEYEFLGNLGRRRLNGKDHYGILMEDKMNQTYKIIMRDSEEGLNELFRENLERKEPGNLLQQERLKYIRDDQSRRQYESLFDIKRDNTPIENRLTKAYLTIDKYNEHSKTLAQQGGLSELDIHEQALSLTVRSLDETLSDNLREKGTHHSRGKVSRIVNIKDKLEGERDLWENTLADAKSLTTIGPEANWRNPAKQNIFIRSVYEQYQDMNPEGKVEKGYEGMKFMAIPKRSISGEMTYMDVSSPGEIESRVRKTLYLGNNQNKSKALLDFRDMLSSSGLDEETQSRLYMQAEKQLTADKKVSPGLLKQVSRSIHRVAHEESSTSGNYVSRIPGMNMRSARPDGTGQADKYVNNLRSREDVLYKRITNQARERANQSFSNKSYSQLMTDNLEDFEKVKRSQDIVQFMEEHVRSNSKIMGINGQPKQDILKKVEHSERIKELAERYVNSGYQVSLDYSKHNDQVYLLFSHESSKLNLAGMSPEERLYSDSVGRVTLPLMNNDGSISVQDTRYRPGYVYSNKGGVHEVQSNMDMAYNQISFIPKNVEDILAEAKQSGQPMTQREAEEIAISRFTNKMRQGGIVSNFTAGLNDEDGFTASSRAKNLTPMMDISAYIEGYAKENYPKEYAKFEKLKKESGNTNAKFLETISDKESMADQFTLRASIKARAIHQWNEDMAPQTGLYVNTYGLNANQATRGVVSMVDQRSYTPGGMQHSAPREQSSKRENYKLMESAPLESYMNTRFTKEEAARRLNPSYTDVFLGHDKITGGEEGLRAIGVRTAFTNDKEISEAAKDAANLIQRDIDQLEAKKATVNKKEQGIIEGLINERRASKDFLESGKASVYEEQNLMRESLMKSVYTKDSMVVKIGDFQELVPELESHITKLNGGATFIKGRLEFDDNHELNYTQMQKLGLVNSRGEITIGTMMEGLMEEEGAEQSLNVSRRLHKHSRIKAIERMSGGGTNVIIENIEQAKDGTKFLGSSSGVRGTFVGVPDIAMDALSETMTGDSKKLLDVIRENPKDSRMPTGQFFAQTVDTMYENAMGDFDKAFNGNLDDVSINLVKEYAQSGMGTDYSKEKEKFISSTFIPKLNDIGYGEFISTERNKNGDLSFKSLVPHDALTKDKGGFELYQRLHKVAKDEFGVDSKYMMAGVMRHDVSFWQSKFKSPRLSVRELNLLDQSLRSLGDGVSGESSLIMQKYESLTGGPLRDAYGEFGSEIKKGLDSFRSVDKISQAEKAGNVIIDMTGRASGADGGVLVQQTKDGEDFFILDGLSISRAPDRNSRLFGDTENTGANLMSVHINSEELAGRYGTDELTVGDLVKQTGGKAFLQVNDSRTSYGQRTGFTRDVVPVMPSFNGSYSQYDSPNQFQAEKAMEDIFNQTQTYYNTTVSGDESFALLNKHLGKINQSMETLQQESSNFLMNSSKGSFNKAMRTVRTENGVAGLAGGYNVLDSKARMHETFVSESYARQMIKGNEFDILRANQIDVEGMSQRDAQNAVIERIRGFSKDDEDFNFVGMVNRQPTQSEGSMVFSNIRIDPTSSKDSERIIIDPWAAKLLGADNDGDTLYASAAHYTGLGDGAEAMQGELIQARGIYEEKQTSLKEGFTFLGDTFSQIAELDPTKKEDAERINNLFQNFSGTSAQLIAGLSNEIKTPGIGRTDNTMVATRDSLAATYQAAVRGGAIDETEYDRIISDWDKTGNLIVQNSISAKKLTTQQLASDGVNFDELDWDQQIRRFEDFIGEHNQAPGMIQKLNLEGVDSAIESFKNIGIIQDEEQEALFRRSFADVAVMRESLVDTGFTNYNESLSVARSTPGRDAATKFFSKVGTSPELVLPTKNAVEMIENFAGSDSELVQSFKGAEDSRTALLSRAISSTMQRKNAMSEGITNSLLKTSGDQFEQMSSLVSEFTSSNRVNSQNKVVAELQQFGGELVKSKSFQAGAGMAAMWMLSSAVKRGPTPEGAEAEEEFASAAEVNPSALLTSPTARVTPRGEDIQLSISGRGNVNRDAIAGIVNNEISQMTHAQMNMNINVTDNTQRLDRGFYQKAVNRALGV